jgi:glycerol-3-phosphate dehydrogenase
MADLGRRTFDLLVIGGGITGCGIARDAALRGLDVALVEKDDFASGTSSRSSRLIHGGVRYVEHGHLALVFEASAERKRLLRLAPHLVRPLEFTWPVYAGARIPRWKLEAGLLLYDVLALFRNVHRHHYLAAARVLSREPRLRREGLRGGSSYFDAATDDARLTLANALGAAEAGAVVVNHLAARRLLRRDDRVEGAAVIDALGGAAFDVRARVVVNAAGPWSDEIRRLAGAAPPAIRGSKGAHIAIERERIGNHGALTLLSPRDGRVFFVLPSGRHAIVGTTDTYTAASPDDVRATIDDVQYLLDAANAFFPEAMLVPDDVVSAWAGIRPLVPSHGDAPGAASREHVIANPGNGLISITGGKLTTYRVMAEQVVDVALDQLGKPRLRSTTARLPLPGGDLESIEATIARARVATADDALARQLVARHGSRWPAVWEYVSTGDGAESVMPGSADRIGELRYAVAAEMACTLGDLLIRRTHIAFEARDHGVGVARRVGDAVAPLLAWDAAALERGIGAYEVEVHRIFAID